MIKRSVLLLCFFFVWIILVGVGEAKDYAISIYGGRITSEHWEETLSTDVDFEDAYLVAASGAWTFKRYFEGALSLELEANIAKHFGDQDHWEFNLPLVGLRWHRFPWQRHLDTTFAWGIGPSYATEVPEVENRINGGSEKWMVYWFGELTFGSPGSNWAVLLRLHHRSEAFGIVAENGGSNTLAVGLKFYF